jgi:hypothetical protein
LWAHKTDSLRRLLDSSIGIVQAEIAFVAGFALADNLVRADHEEQSPVLVRL